MYSSENERYVNHVLIKGEFLGITKKGKSTATGIPFVFFKIYTESNVYPGVDASEHQIKATGDEFVNKISGLENGSLIKISGCLIQYNNHISNKLVVWIKVKKIIEI